MKRVISLAVLAMFTAAVVGCEASAKVGDPDDSTKTTYKKTTVTEPNGDTSTKVETRTDR